MASVIPTSARNFIHASGIPASPLKNARKFPAIAIAVLLVIIVPYLHIGVIYSKFWVPNKTPVNKEDCTCTCFDTIFKGSYEKAGHSGYKHVYFNATQNSFKIWSVTVVFLVMFYESLKYLVGLYQTSRLQKSWLCLYLINIYPNYYSWWMLFGYYNDEFYYYLSHQIYFCVTELVGTGLVLHLCNKQSEPHLWKILLVFSISLVHVFVSSLDQFVSNVILGQGKTFQNSRDFGLMVPDILHLLVAGYWYVRLVYCYSHNSSYNSPNRRDSQQGDGGGGVGVCVCVPSLASSSSSSLSNSKLSPLLSTSSVQRSVVTGSRKRDLVFVSCVVMVLVGFAHLL